MADIGAARKILLSHGAQIMVTQSGTTGTTDRFIALRTADLDVVHPQRRINFGNDREYKHARPDIILRFTLHATDDSVDEFFGDRGNQDANLEIPVYKWTFKAGGFAGNKQTLEFTGKLFRHHIARETDEHHAPLAISCEIIGKDTDITVK